MFVLLGFQLYMFASKHRTKIDEIDKHATDFK